MKRGVLMRRSKWKIAQYSKEKAAMAAERFELDPLAALLTVSRGVDTPEAIEEFFSSDIILSDPFMYADMEKAAERINLAIDNFERIAVYGDYDADGVTATALLYSYLQARGADVICYIPDREEDGYGLNMEAIKELHDREVKLIVTVDNGVSAIEEAEYIEKLGMELVVTDHHQPGEVLPKAVAVVDPHREDCHGECKCLAGVGVAFKLATALENEGPEALADEYADIVALGTVADVVPLTGENRMIVKHGLELINTSPRPGIAALLNAAGCGGKEVDSTTIAFALAPRINAAGRMGSANRALNLILSEEEELSETLAGEISLANEERQRTEQTILSEALDTIEKNPSKKYARVIAVKGEGWHCGVIGIVAARITRQYGKPCFVISVDPETGEAKGSGRSVEGFSLYDALADCSELFTKFGGHTLAAGLSINRENIDEFEKRINTYASRFSDIFPTLELSCRLNPSYITPAILPVIESIEPFGAENPKPVFGLFKMTVDKVDGMGGGKHMRLTAHRGNGSITAVKFGVSPEEFGFIPGDIIDLAVTVEANVFRGEKRVSVRLVEARPSDEDEEEFFSCVELYEKWQRGEELSDEEKEKACPVRKDIAAVFKCIIANSGWRLPIEFLNWRLRKFSLNYCKTAIAAEVLCEMGILKKNGSFIEIHDPSTKVDLANSEILKSLQRGEVNG